MKVHLIKKKTIEYYVTNHASGCSAFQHWLTALKFADWIVPQDMLSTFKNTDLLGKSSNRAVFDVGGNNYRVICTYYFGRDQVHLFANWIGTHAEYDKVCSRSEQYTISKY